MKSLCVSLESVDKIKDFVNTMNNIEGAAFLSGGRSGVGGSGYTKWQV